MSVTRSGTGEAKRRLGGLLPRIRSAKPRQDILGVRLEEGVVSAADLLHEQLAAYRRLVSDWQPKNGAGATAGRASSKPSSGKQRGRALVPDPAL
jgi:hypothetical protein